MTSASLPGRGPSTTAVHAGQPETEVGASVVTPIYQTTTFFTDAAGEAEVRYTRFGNNPNHRGLEQRIAAITGAEDSVVTGSGMGAMAAALLACVQAGDHVLAASALYGGTRTLLHRELSRLGIETTFVDVNEPGWERQLRPNTRAVVIETVSNPLLRLVDPAAVAPFARQVGARVIVDATFTPPPNCPSRRRKESGIKGSPS